MPHPWLGSPIDGADLNRDFFRLLAASRVRDRLALVDQGLAALADHQPCTFHLLDTRVTLDVGQARALSWHFLTDPSRQVRRRFAQRLGSLEWQDRFPFAARLAWDSDHRVRLLAEHNLGEVEPFLASWGQYAGHEPQPHSLGSTTPMEVTIDGPVTVPLGEFRAHDAPPSRSIPIESGPAPAANAPPPPASPRGGPAEAGEGPSADEEVIHRYTDCGFTADVQAPGAGRVSFALRVQAADGESRPVDLRVPAGKQFATVLVHAFSQQFTVGPEVWFVKVPRAADSDVAEFTVRAEKPADGEVGLLVYDEYRLIGSLTVRLRAAETPQGLRLEKLGTIIFRDPAPTLSAQSNGITVQVSLTGGDSRVAFHLLVPLPEGDAWKPNLFPLGRSVDPLEVEGVQTALKALRAAIDEIERDLDNPAALGVATAGEALQAIRLNLKGAGHHVAEDILSPSAWAVLAHLRPGSIIHWVIRDSKLDAVPWELAWNAATGHHLNQDFVLVRVPVRDSPVHNGDAVGLSATQALPPAPDRLLYLLGDGVATTPAAYPLLRELVRSVGGYQVVTNFEGNVRTKVTIIQLSEQIREAKVIHLLCHGLVEEDRGYLLEIEPTALGRLAPSQVRGFQLPSNAVVFVNACSSASASFSVSGLTTFGWSFLRAGARAYIGTLAPATTTVALRFAQELFTAHLDRKLPLPQAMYEARQQLTAVEDPTWLLYTLYGDLSEAPQTQEP
ncbi:MAG: CHAT domain-containing protein [Thermoanaerobaculia bacterium]|nr:CHAT domain-containing protein [Thermoanaerobaculia bacterium]